MEISLTDFVELCRGRGGTGQRGKEEVLKEEEEEQEETGNEKATLFAILLKIAT